ncbi:hypothetical protein HYW82_03915 [Candidatus Peregrinibacteria bacterium]|nr:hypothetical protein [Candidatus Peregrinibacteria bacterium]
MKKTTIITIIILAVLLTTGAIFFFNGKYGSGFIRKARTYRGNPYGAEGTLVPCPEDSSKACCEGTVDECRPLCKAEPGGCWKMLPANKTYRSR